MSDGWLSALLNAVGTDTVEASATHARPRGRAAYEAAKMSRTTASWVASQLSADAAILGDLGRLRDLCRDLVRNNPQVHNALLTYRRNVIGNGMHLQPLLRHPTKKNKRGRPVLDRDLNAAIIDLFYRWQRKEYCSPSGRYSFLEAQGVAFSEAVEAGEVIVRHYMGSRFDLGAGVPYAFEVLEADHLDHTYKKRLDGGREVRGGIEYNAWGRPIAYYLWDRHPGDRANPFTLSAYYSQREPRRIPAEKITHVLLPLRAGQGRGVPWFSTIFKPARHTQGYVEAEIVRARWGASIMATLEQPDDEEGGASTVADDDEVLSGPGESGDAVDAEGEPMEWLEPGRIRKLLPGEKLNAFMPNSPAGNFDPFILAMHRELAIGLGLAYSTVTGDFSKANFSSSRMGKLQENDLYTQAQIWFAGNFATEVYRRWFQAAVLTSKIKVPGYELDPLKYEDAHKWQARGQVLVDPVTDIETALKAIDGGLSTLRDEQAKRGIDFDQWLEERAEEQELLAEHNITLNSIALKGGSAPSKPAADSKEDPNGEETQPK